MTETNEKVTFALPIGAMGNIAAGHLAKICGLPIARFVGSVNINDITHRVFSKGEFHIQEEMFKNLSEAINIQAPYNFERILYWSTGMFEEVSDSGDRIRFCHQHLSSTYFLRKRLKVGETNVS